MLQRTDAATEADILRAGKGQLEQRMLDEARRKALRRRFELIAARLAAMVLFLGLWQLVSGTLIREIWISNPVLVSVRLAEWLVSLEFWDHVWITVQETILGFIIGALSGVTVGLILGRATFLGDVFRPFIMAFYSLPKLALAPLLILWLGIGIEMKVALSALVVFFLVFYNTYTGAANVDRTILAIVRTMGASRTQVLTKVVIPSALLWVFAGIRVSVPYALLGAVVGEMFASNRGLGHLVQRGSSLYDTTGVFAALIVLVVVATIILALVNIVEKSTVRWRIESE